MREIEVKARLVDMDAFLAAAKKLGIIFGRAVAQEDVTYESNIPYDDSRWNIFRIRKQDTTVMLTMKHKASNRSRDNYEYETTIENEDSVIKMLERLGYTFGVRVRKIRRTATYNGLELCLDEIEHLGSFVEVEKLAEDATDVDAIQLQLWALLQQLGVDDTERIHKGYDTLMHELTQTH